MKNIALIACFACILQSSFGQQYFRTIPFSHTPLNTFRGGVPFKSDQDSVALYCIQFENDLLKSMTYKINQKIKPLYENYTCSDYIWAPVNSFEYRENSIIVNHYDYLGNPPKSNPAVSVFSKDKQGRIIGLKYYDKDNAPSEFRGVHQYVWKYLDGGIGEIRYSSIGSPVPLNNWFPYTWVILNIDDDKNLRSIVTTSDNWTPKEDAIKVEFTYKNNDIVSWVAWTIATGKKSNLTGPKVAEARHDYNAYGYLEMTRFYDVQGNRTKSVWGHKGFRRLYNDRGNRMLYNFINEQDEIELAKDRGYSGQKFIWDQEGRFRIQTFYINENEMPVFREARGFATLHFIYNHDGKEIGKIYRDENGQVLNTEKAESFILIDNNGKMEKITF